MGRRNLLQAARDFFYGMLGYEFGRQALQARSVREMLMITVLFGDLLGVPLFRAYYSLALLPFVVPRLPGWKHQLSRQRDFGGGFDSHGI